MRVNFKRIETVLNILVSFVKTTPLPLPPSVLRTSGDTDGVQQAL